ncbi:ATP-binding cassette domain-containing protein [Enterococcus hirae]|nr:ATP-binding cassette domain-containing protein [Enterococcus hirae]EMF0062315.1 ATP-binding cassette domain-containing protein [Enterococcus hirae]EMF0086987.1 ATP-binding cassette domain-containing protein [Enterococcus hirae]EMF0178148.1 ATP-binding cassette domain-containing protein [Enterococcus hirae]MBA5268007.1 ATP-binding cassette domain-containing protein [Enterococcus hirae]MBE8830553.1 ATP-binding cassette domain-containing protein [Enterococcus hirae]
MLSLIEIKKVFGNEIVLNHLSGDFQKGLNFIYGPSGSGKTTLLNIISGMDQNFEGDVYFNNQSMKRFTKKELSDYYYNSIGFIWQDYQLIEYLSVECNIDLVLSLSNLNKAERKMKVAKVLEELGISGLAKMKVAKLSGEQKQRVAIARALVKDPEIIIADEPTKHLDIKSPTLISSNLSMIYGDMPKDNRNEISLSLSVASSLSKNINQLVGKYVDFEYFDKEGQKHKIKMKVSGISNDTFDNFTMSTKLEKKIYKEVARGEASAIAFSVKNFEDIPKIHRLLKSKGYDIYTKEKDIRAFKNSFADTIKLFTILSNLLLLLFISVSFIIIYRISITRYSEVGILSCLGYSTRNISKILRRETVLFCLLSVLFSSIWLLIFNTVYSQNFGYNLEFNFQLGMLLLLVNIGLVFGITGFVNYRLVNLSPSLALKK